MMTGNISEQRAAITSRLKGMDWRSLLVALGVPERILSGRNQACPSCGGRDRFRFTNHDGRGMYYCNKCGPGDAVDLLCMLFGWKPADAARAILAAIEDGTIVRGNITGTAKQNCRQQDEQARVWTPKCRRIWSECAILVSVPSVRKYLLGRGLAVPRTQALRSHPSLDYWDVDENGLYVRAGRFPALIARITDVEDKPVSLHVTWTSDGRKADVTSPKKIISRLGDRTGCAVRIFSPESGTVGIAEGIETAIAAHDLTGVPTWAALSCVIMEKWLPPPDISRVVIFPDNDAPGMHAACILAERLLNMGVTVEMRLLGHKYGDWADAAIDDSPVPGARRGVDISRKLVYGGGVLSKRRRNVS